MKSEQSFAILWSFSDLKFVWCSFGLVRWLVKTQTQLESCARSANMDMDMDGKHGHGYGWALSWQPSKYCAMYCQAMVVVSAAAQRAEALSYWPVSPSLASDWSNTVMALCTIVTPFYWSNCFPEPMSCILSRFLKIIVNILWIFLFKKFHFRLQWSFGARMMEGGGSAIMESLDHCSVNGAQVGKHGILRERVKRWNARW